MSYVVHPKALICPKGHCLTPENSRLYVNKKPNGNRLPRRICLQCREQERKK